MQQYIQRALITERTLFLASKGWFTFIADIAANKPQIASDIEALYKVDVTNIRTVTMPTKTRRAGKKMKTRTIAAWKKALVQLAKGQTIPDFDVPKEAEKK